MQSIVYKDKPVLQADGKLYAKNIHVKVLSGNGSGGGKHTLGMATIAGCGNACGTSWYAGAVMEGSGGDGGNYL